MSQVSQWAIVELFGHQRIAGRISEQEVGGQKFVRVDVPSIERTDHAGKVERIEPHTKSFGAGAIYAINWVDEQAARVAAHSIRHTPIDTWALAEALRNMTYSDRQRLLTAPVGTIVFDEDDGEPRF